MRRASVVLSVTPILVSLLCHAAPAPAQDGAWSVRGSDVVVLGRTYRRDAAGTTAPTGLFGLVLGRESATRTVSVAREAGGAFGEHSIRVVARRKDDGARVELRLDGIGSPDPPVHRVVRRGAPAHVPLARRDGEELFAALEVGRAADFAHARLARHFEPAAATRTAGAPEPRAAPAAPGRAADLAPGVLTLSFRVEQDGETVFAPRVTVRNGEEFAVRGGGTVHLGGAERFDGIELAGVPRDDGTVTWLDLSVQSGRALPGDGPAVFLVDRYRRDLRLPRGSPVVVDLFEDLGAGRGGALSLRVTVTRD